MLYFRSYRSFPLLDFHYKVGIEGDEGVGYDLLEADDSLFMKKLKDVKIVHRKKKEMLIAESSSFVKIELV